MRVALLSSIIFITDQLCKYYMQQLLKFEMSLPVVQNVFHLTLVHNYGAAFGMLPHQRWFFILIAVLLVGAIAYAIPKIPRDKQLLLWSAGLLLGGALGNAVDRIRFGYVLDFFDFRVWPVFNIADIAIVVGVGLFALDMLRPAKCEEPDGDTRI